jgi:hypothetical protein
MVGQMHLEENTPKDGPNGERLTWSSFLSLLGLKEVEKSCIYLVDFPFIVDS